MPAMKFQLQSVLDYREQIVDLRQSELAELESRLQAERLVLISLRQRIADLADGIRIVQQGGGLNCDDLSYKMAYLEQLESRETAQIARVRECRQERDAKRQELMQAAQDKQVIEKLKERRLEQRRAEELHREGQVLDEISVVRFLRTAEPGS
jgi:flagellar protein FliJ